MGSESADDGGVAFNGNANSGDPEGNIFIVNRITIKRFIEMVI